MMPLVNVVVNSRTYAIACDEGEEEHLKELAGHVDAKVRELAGTVGQVGDQKLMLMAAVLITDELLETRARLEGHTKKVGELSEAQAELSGQAGKSEERAARTLEDAAKRIESIVDRIKAA
jgi:cell division protein ZapA